MERMSPEWKDGTSIERFIDGVGYKAFVVHRGTVPTTLAYIRYLDDGKEELEVPIDECKIIPSPSNEVMGMHFKGSGLSWMLSKVQCIVESLIPTFLKVEEPHEASAAMTDCSNDSSHGVKDTAASFAMEEDTELKISESNSSGKDRQNSLVLRINLVIVCALQSFVFNWRHRTGSDNNLERPSSNAENIEPEGDVILAND